MCASLSLRCTGMPGSDSIQPRAASSSAQASSWVIQSRRISISVVLTPSLMCVFWFVWVHVVRCSFVFRIVSRRRFGSARSEAPLCPEPFLEDSQGFLIGESEICSTCGTKSNYMKGHAPSGCDLAGVCYRAPHTGALAPIASRVLMKGHMRAWARPDSLTAVSLSARLFLGIVL